jgi:hypothetical protein
LVVFDFVGDFKVAPALFFLRVFTAAVAGRAASEGQTPHPWPPGVRRHYRALLEAGLFLQKWPRIGRATAGKRCSNTSLKSESRPEMQKYIEGVTIDLSCLDGEEFQVALRVAVDDLRDREAIFNEFLSESGYPDRQNWKRSVQYSHLHLLFAQTIVANLMAQSDRRTITQTGSQLRLTTRLLPRCSLRKAKFRNRMPPTANLQRHSSDSAIMGKWRSVRIPIEITGASVASTRSALRSGGP